MTQRERGWRGAEAPLVPTATWKQRRLSYITVHYSGDYSATTQASDGEVFVLSARPPVWIRLALHEFNDTLIEAIPRYTICPIALER